MQTTRIIKQGQSILDAALCEFASAEAAFVFALQNGKSLTDEPETGTLMLVYGETKHIYPTKEEPATAINQNSAAEPEPEGIGYWAVGQNFKVS